MIRHARHRGAAMTETVLVLPLIFLILALLIFFGLNMQRLQRVAVADRYEAWRQTVPAPGPSGEQQINDAFFGSRAVDVRIESDARGGLRDAEQLVIDETMSLSYEAAAWVERMYEDLPGLRRVGVRVEHEPPVPVLSRFTGPIRHHHAVIDGDWRYAAWADLLEFGDDRVNGGRRTVLYPSLADHFFELIEAQLEPLDSSGNAIAGGLRRAYYAVPDYRGPGDEAYWRRFLRGFSRAP